jgi:hypothetical protein
MSGNSDAPDPYDLKSLERRLGEDDGLAELGIRVCALGEQLFVQGTVSGEQRREQALARVRAAFPGRDVVDELECSDASLGAGPGPVEEIR